MNLFLIKLHDLKNICDLNGHTKIVERINKIIGKEFSKWEYCTMEDISDLSLYREYIINTSKKERLKK